jgi:phage repressor protein C with HTH and peptisase S24 domain
MANNAMWVQQFRVATMMAADTVGGRLRMVRQARGLTPGDLAEACEVSRQAISYWERAIWHPNAANLERAAKRLNVSIEWLRTGDGLTPDLRIIPLVGRTVTPPPPLPRPEPPQPGMIPEQVMGIGSGPLLLDGRIHDWWKLPPGLISETLRTLPEYLTVLRVLSDSMEPAVKLYDYVILDQADTTPVDGKIYAIDNGVGVVLRRILVEGESLTLRADSDPTQDVKVPHDEVRIVGRCVITVVIT